MFGQSEIQQALNVSTITTGLSTYTKGETAYPALFFGNVLPTKKTYSGPKSINYYMSTARNEALDYEQYNYSVNCRAETYNESLTIAKLVIDEVNRKSYTNFFITVSLLPTIQPSDSTDNFNTPLELTLQKR